MEYRKLPCGSETEKFSSLGLGFGALAAASDSEIEAIVYKALENGINFFDLCTAKNVFAPFGRAIKDVRDRVFFQMHFGAVYSNDGEYGWSRSLDKIRETIEFEFDALGTDYADFGFLHCVDELDDFDTLVNNGILDYIKQLKSAGKIRHIGFSSHTPSVANRIIDTGVADMMMFSINPAYDCEHADDCGNGSAEERSKLFRRCAAEGIGISVMKPFMAGKLLTSDSPFGTPLSIYQCIKYALDRPGVLSVVPGIEKLEDLDALLRYFTCSEKDLDYSEISSFTPENIFGICVYCNHCQPCPAEIDIALVNKYYDLAMAGDRFAAGHYDKLRLNASDCLHCGHCDSRCPFKVSQSTRMEEINIYFSK